MKKNSIVSVAVIIFLIIWNTETSGQHPFLSTPNAYLGQRPPGDTPQIFARALLVPDSGIAMDRSAFSQDGREFYYGKAMHWFSSQSAGVGYFRFDGINWKGPLNLFPGYYAPTFSLDGQSMYLLAGKGDSIHFYVWVAHRTKKGWSYPEVYLRKEYGLYDFMPTKSGTCYVGSNAYQGSLTNFQSYDFCRLNFSATDTTIESLGPSINTPGFDGDFYVAPDESYMIVSYHEKPDFECELGISFRKDDNTWTEPQNLGSLINDGDAHRWGEYVSPDGKYLFYSKGTSEKDCHLYWVRFDKLKERLREEAFH